MGRSLSGAVLSAPQLPVGKDPYTWASAGAPLQAAIANLPSALNDGSFVSISQSNTISLYNSVGAVVWSKSANSIITSESSNVFLPAVWVDTVDGAIYVLIASTTASSGLVHPVKILLATGTTIVLGTGVALSANMMSSSGSLAGSMTRAGIGSGDFTLFGNASNSLPPRVISFSSTTGSATSAEAAATSGGVAIKTAIGNPISYKSSDGTILVGAPMISNSSAYSSFAIPLYRNGKTALFFLQDAKFNANTASVVSTNISFAVVGQTVYPFSFSGIITGLIQPMLRSDFDAFLAAACTFMGI